MHILESSPEQQATTQHPDLDNEKGRELEHLQERGQFRALLLGNPNYFGNLKESQYQPVLDISGNTFYESIGCVGYQPQFNRLEAVVFVNQSGGYGGDVCSAGTPEYVRFYLSFDNGGSWVDQGLVSFTAYDIPIDVTGGQRLEYAVALRVNLRRRFCFFDQRTVLARAILSWNTPPPANTPYHIPIWGDIHDTHIQVEPLRFPKLLDVFEATKLELPSAVLDTFDLEQELTAKEPQVLSVPQLQELYKDKKIEPHRYALAELHQLMAHPEGSESLMLPGGPSIFDQLKLGIDFSDIFDQLFPKDGNTSYEELECVGLNPLENTLEAVIRIKRGFGYSGGPCTPGSTEYVTFWADIHRDGSFHACLGTAAVTVYDFEDVPEEGLEYAVFLPVDLNRYRRECDEGAVVIPIRATLSWNVPIPCSNPNQVPTWGNREETLVHVYPGRPVDDDDYTPFLYDVSGVAVCAIDQATGYATGQKPFGATLFVTGEIPAALSLATPDTLKYRVSVRQLTPVVSGWQVVGNSFSITVTEGTGPITAVSYSILQSVDADGFYTYREHGTPVLGAWRRVSSMNRLLVPWNTAAPMTGQWEIKLEAKDTLTGTIYQAGIITCPDGTTLQSVRVRLDEIAPVADIAITGFSRGGGPVQPAIDCAKFQIGDIIHGTYSGTDEHFRRLDFELQPASVTGGATVEPPQRVFGAPDFVPTGGEAGTWTLDTTLMAPCGYTIKLLVHDRTIVSGSHSGWLGTDVIGFCVETPGG